MRLICTCLTVLDFTYSVTPTSQYHSTPFTLNHQQQPTYYTNHYSTNRSRRYTGLPLPTISPTDIRVLSHNINSLPTSSTDKLGATFDLYHHLSPSIIGLQETNKNWNCYDATSHWPSKTLYRTSMAWIKMAMAHCSEEAFHTPAQPGGVAQMMIRMA
jgi:hypothetical protein